MTDLVRLHLEALACYHVGLAKQAADLHFSGQLQVNRYGQLIIQVPSGLLRGCLSAIGDPGVELHQPYGTWEPSFCVMTKDELDSIGGPRVVTERGKSFDYRVVGSRSRPSMMEGLEKIWYLEIEAPELEKLRQSYGLRGEYLDGGFKAIFGSRKSRLFRDGDRVTKDLTPQQVKPESFVGLPKIVGSEWVLKKRGALGVKRADILPSVQLQPHQQALAEEINPDSPARKLMMWQVGSGKSLGSIAAAEAFGKPYTVVGPAAIRPTFRSEQKKFTDQSLPSAVISYQKAMREGGIPHPESLVVDEAQRIVNPASRQSQAIQEAARHAQQVLLLSGTPIINRPGDLAPAFSILTGRDMSPEAFEKRYLGQGYRPRSWGEWLSGRDRVQTPVVRHRDELKSLLEGKVDWYAPQNPTVSTRYSDHELEMSPEQAKLYRAMFGKIPWRLRLGLDGSTDLTPQELQRLKSFLSGPRQVGLSDYPFAKHQDPLRSFYGSSKLQAAFRNLKEKLDQDPRHKAIVYSNFPRAGLEPYRAALQHHAIPHIVFDGSLSDPEREAAVRDFNEGRARVALVGPAGAEGISLKGAQVLQQLDPHWNEARMRQSAARGIRFDSHQDLPEELQNIEIQRYISKLPAKDRSFLQALRLLPYRPELQPASDDYLRAMSDRKEKANQLFLDLLKEIGTRKTSSSECDHHWRPEGDHPSCWQAFCHECGAYCCGTRGYPGAHYRYFRIPDRYCRNCCGCSEQEPTYFYQDLKAPDLEDLTTVVKRSSLTTLSGDHVATLPAIKIDRPKGFQKVFNTPRGKEISTYPVDYGYFDGIINPDDQDGADVFVGTGGAAGLHGRFMKGKTLTGKWEPDERKWYANLTPEEHAAVLRFYTEQDPTLLQDHVAFKTHADLLNDLKALGVKTANQQNREEPKLDPKAVQKGQQHEMEHTEDPQEAREIGLDHLREDPDYYEKLDILEESSLQDLRELKKAQLAMVELHDACRDCGNAIKLKMRDLCGGEHVTCGNCGKRNLILPEDRHREALLHQAAAHTDQSPTDPQRQAGNYRKGKFCWQGFVIAIENPKGSTRRGLDQQGKPWETTFQDHYGYILRHVSEADGDHMDCFVGPDPDSHKVFVIDQYLDGKFDEHKVVLMARTAQQAREIYNRNYQKGWKGLRNLTSMSLREFRDWLLSGDTSKPVFVPVTKADQQRVKAALGSIPEKHKACGDYGDVWLNARRKRMYLSCGDGWEKPQRLAYEKALKTALPDWDLMVDCEWAPPGYVEDHDGDWARIKP